jgi:hypothetical protein
MSDTFTEDGRDFYKSNGSPVWPGRYRERPDMKTGQPKGSLVDDKFVRTILAQLDELEMMSRPTNGLGSEKSKDLNAFSALHNVAWLSKYLTQWAIDHEIGLAMNGLRFVPLMPDQTRKLPEYQAAKAVVDDHEHERAGGTYLEADASPEMARRIAINILSPISSSLGLGPLLEALKALETGEVRPILRPVSNADKARYTEARFQLEAVALVAYWTVLKNKKIKAQELVAAGFRVRVHTLRGWESRLREKLGTIEVNAAVSRAHNCAKTFEVEDQKKKLGDQFADPEYFDFSYGPRSAVEIGKRYHRFLREDDPA